MKKVLTVLAVLVLLTGVVFAATETHTIKVSSTVNPDLPAFQLILGDITTNDGTTPVKFENAKAYAPYVPAVEDDPNTTDIDESAPARNIYASAVNFASNGGSFEVSAKLANAAKQVKVYTLTFKGGIFTVTRAVGESTLIVVRTYQLINLQLINTGSLWLLKLDVAVAGLPALAGRDSGL